MLLIQILFFYNEVKRDITSVAQKIDLMYEWNTSRVLAEKPDFAKCNHPPSTPYPTPGTSTEY